MLFFVMLFIVCVGGCWLFFRAIGRALFPEKNGGGPYTYVDKSVHHHHHLHDNRTINVNGEQFKKLKK